MVKVEEYDEWPDRSPVEGTDGDQVNHNHETGENADEI